MVVLGHRHGQRRALVLPVGNQLIERLGIDHRARQDVRADLAPFSRMQTESSRPAAFASCLRRIAALSPAGPAPTITTSYCMDSRSLIGPLVASRQHIRLVRPANSLTMTSMAGEEERTWAGKWNRSALPRRGAHWPGGSRPASTSPFRKKPRDWLKPAPRAAEAEQPNRRQPRTSSSRATKRSPTSSNGWRAARNCRSLGHGASAILPARARRAGGHAAQRRAAPRIATAGQPIGGDAWELDAAHARRDRHSAGGSVQRVAFLLPCARRADDRRRSARPAPRSPASTSGWRSRSGCFCLATGLHGAARQAAAAARGHVHKVEGVRTVATFHPRQLINQP